ncbi:Gfo/Idh/MocA family oxidoreductase [Olivibacter ginsenosidimutans]|uniref:Gfo/Idh/MocA family oxidoreductase n=1 Tax=Olivibacter ginsenosidimutans TaxID=1176537 RepID=A0ABP9C0K9_9SPHI
MKTNQLTRRKFIKQSVKGSAVLFTAATFPTIVPASVFGKNAPSNRIHVGQIGFGRIGMTHDLPEVMKHDYVTVAAVADLDSNRLKQGKAWIEKRHLDNFGKTITVKTYADYKDLIASGDIDAVVISTPDHWHAQPAMEAALAGKHIYLQKPTSLTIQEGRTMADAVKKAGVVFQLGSQQRSIHPWPQFKRTCELVRNGRIGTLKSVKIGLPIDPPGGNTTKMPVPPNLNYDMWLGSTPEVYYTEDRVHSQKAINGDRPGWLRCEQFGAGMITGWGVHHFDIAHWGMDTELSGPIEIEGKAEFPTSGLWDVHGKYEIHALYPNNVQVEVKDTFPNGIRFEGTDGWIFVSRGDVGVTASDPTAASDGKSHEAFTASDKKILTSEIGPNEIHLYESPEQHTNWLECIRDGKPTISPVEVAQHVGSACLVAHTAMKLGRKLRWDTKTEKFIGDEEANTMLSRPQRFPYGTEHVKG